MDNIYQWYTWIISFFIRQPVQNQIDNNNQQQQQQQQDATVAGAGTGVVEPQHTITINENSNNNNVIPTSPQRPTQTTSNTNSFKNIDQKPTISLKDYKKKIKDYLNEEFEIDEDLIYSHIIHNLSIEESDSLEKQFEAMNSILSKIENEKIKFSIINTIIEHFKSVYSIHSKENLISFYAVLVSCCNLFGDNDGDKFKNELSNVIKDLPPSVLGDLVNRNTSRVLVDLQEDVLDSCRLDKSQMIIHSSLISGVSSVLFDFINNHKLPGTTSTSTTIIKNELIASLLLNLHPIFRSKLLFQHFIIYKLIQPQPESRQSIINYLFSYKPQVLLNKNDDNNSTTTTTTTTTTSNNN